MKQNTKLLLVTAVALIAVLSISGGFFAHASASISTDKSDYQPGETVVISGASFSSPPITVSVARPDGNTDQCSPSGPSQRFLGACPTTGDFQISYQLDGIVGLYTLTGTGTNPQDTATNYFADINVDFKQCANDDPTSPSPIMLNECHWINSILQGTNSLYFEGNSVNQRTLFDGVPSASDNAHTLQFSHEGVKTQGGTPVHAYDFLTGYEPAQGNGPTLANGLNECGQEIPASLTTTCALTSGSPLLVQIPTDNYVSGVCVPFSTANCKTSNRIGNFTATYGTRYVKIFGNMAFSDSNPCTTCLTITHTSAPGADTTGDFVQYMLTWHSASDKIVIEMAGHLAIGGSISANPMAWGTGRGSSNISGGPYHFKLLELDTPMAAKPADQVISLGSQDNQIKSSGIFTVGLSCPASGTTGKPITCTATPSGGAAPFTFVWSAPGGSPSSLTTTGSTSTFTTAYGSPGTYTITLTVTDANGISVTTSSTFTITIQPKVLTATCDSATAGKPFTCHATSQASSFGGLLPINFTWTAPGGTPSRQTSSGSATSSNFTTQFPTKGPFTVTVTQKDADGSTFTQTIPVNVAQQPLVASVNCGTGQTAGKPFTCTVSATGGSTPYAGTGSFTVTEPVKGTFTESFTVTDANGKHVVASTQVNVAQQPFVASVTCGSAGTPITAGKPFNCTVSATGGTAPYQGTGSFSVTQPVKGTFTESFTVKDANGKSAVASTQVTVVQQPFVVSVVCGGSVPGPTGPVITAGKPFTCTVSATGGTEPYQGTGSFQVTEPVKGTFVERFAVKDANGKTAVASTQVTVVQQPFVVSVSCGSATTAITAGKPFTCTVSATGGTQPYSGTGSFTVTEPVKGTFTESFNVRDANGKTAVASTQVTVVQQPFVVSVTCGTATAAITAGKPFSCTVSATGGTGPYQGTGSFTVTEPVKGTFTESFTVKDANGKSAVASTTVTVVQQPFVVSVTCGGSVPTPTGPAITAGKPFSCTVSATGGTEPYHGTGTFTVIEPVKGTFHESFGVSDANGKTAVATTTVTVVQQPFVVAVSCGGSIPTPTGPVITAGKPFSCKVSATGGTEPYQGTGSFQVTEPVKGTFTESFKVTDSNGKSAIASTQVTVVQQPFIVSVVCTGAGAAITAGKPFVCQVSATGGTEPYTGTGSFQVTEPVKGTFTERFTVNDANGKTAVASTQVTVVQQPFLVSVVCGSASAPITAGKPFDCNVSASGGTGPYSGTGSFQIIEPVKGTFTERFQVSDANGKTAVASTQVTVVQQPFVVSVTCGGSIPGPTGPVITAGKPFTCTVKASGGTEPYQGTGTFTVIEPVKGTFVERFPVKDANGKTAVASTQITVVQQPFVVSVTCGSAGAPITAGKPFTCNVSATGGTEPYQGTGSFQVTEPVKGTFTESFKVTDANGKSAVASTQVTVVQQPFVVSVSCGTATGSITAGKPFTCTVSATGGTGPYQGTGSFTVTELVKGTFHESFTVRDANGKSAVATTTVDVVQQPFVVSVTCGGSVPTPIGPVITAGKPFTCTVKASGGTAPYRGTGDFVVTEPVKGTFTESFIVYDANGKSAVASTQVTVVQQPFVVSVTCGSPGTPITAGKPFTCTVSATGGTEPYQGTGSFQVIEPVKGTFTERFPVKDANGKTAVASTQVAVVQQPFVVSVTCGSASAPITAGKPFTCTVSATGGTAPYQGTGSFTVTEPVKGTFTESFIVYDANGKSATASTQVTVVQQPFVVSVTCGSLAPAPSEGPGITAGKPFICHVKASGGTEPYQGTGDFTVTEPVKGTFTESFNVKDANGKTAVASTQVSVVQQPFVVSVTCGTVGTPITAGKPFSCTVSASGGTAPYQGTGSFTVTEPVKGTFTESFKVSDANGKSAKASTQVTVVQQPFVVSVTCGSASTAITAGKPFTCTVSATGGTEPYQGTGSFQISEPVKGTFTESFRVTDANGKSAVASTQVTVVQQPFVVSVSCGSATSPITAGKPFTCTVSATGGTEPYQGTGSFQITEPVKGTFTESFNVKDANGKTAVASTQVTVVQQPFVVSVTCGSAGAPITAGKPFTCTVSATGGTEPYQGTGSFTVTEPVKGIFKESFIVKDANGKSAIASTQVTVVQQPFVVSVTCGSASAAATAGKPFTCTVSATGGTAPYRGTGSFQVTQPVKGTFTESFNVTDANGKSAIASTQVTVVQQPFVVSVTCGSSSVPVTAGKPFICVVSASGGTAPYRGVGNFTVTEPVKGTFTEQFTVTDANGKSAIASTQVTVVQQPFVVSVTCGTVGTPITAGKPFNCVVSASGGTAPYTGAGTFSRTEPVKGTFTESFKVTDSNGKSAIASTTVVVVPQPLVITVSCSPGATAGKPITCNASATGGTAAYTFTWSAPGGVPPSGSGASFTTTFAVKGSYTVTGTVKDSNNRTASVGVHVVVNGQPLVADFTTVCSGATNVFTGTVSGGTAPYTFSWNFGDGSAPATGNPVSHTYSTAGPFTVVLTVTDVNGAKTTVTHSVLPCSRVAVTDTSFCPLPNNNFVLIYITDPANPSAFRLVASNPGQFYDNVFFFGTPGSPVSLTINLPFPFITQGSVPIQVSSSFSISGGCFLPSFDATSQFTITAPGPLSPSGAPTVVLSNYSPQAFGSTVAITVTGTVPATGLVYVTVHMDYGLKTKTSGSDFNKVAPGSSAPLSPFPACSLSNTDPCAQEVANPSVLVNSPQSYTFTVGGSLSSSATVTSTNVFKKDPGFAGVVLDSSGTPIANAKVKIYDPNGNLLGIVYTDVQGVYLYQYKYTGPKVNFTVVATNTLTNTSLTATVQMQSNKLIEQDFQFS